MCTCTIYLSQQTIVGIFLSKHNSKIERKFISWMNYFIQAQTQVINTLAFSFVRPSSGKLSLPFLFSLEARMAPLRSPDFSGPHFDALKPCLRILKAKMSPI